MTSHLYGEDTATAVMNSQKLQMPALDLHRDGPKNSQVWTEEGSATFAIHSLLNYLLLIDPVAFQLLATGTSFSCSEFYTSLLILKYNVNL